MFITKFSLRYHQRCDFNKAIAGDAVVVATGTYTDTKPEVVLINKSVTLAGGWDNTFTVQNGISFIDGQSIHRGVVINYDISTLLDRFTIQNGGNVYSGGGILNSGGTVLVNNSTIRNNKIGNGSGPFGGGGIENHGTFTLNNSTINGNTIVGGFSGSGIYNGGVFTLNNSTVSGNTNGKSGIYNEGEFQP